MSIFGLRDRGQRQIVENPNFREPETRTPVVSEEIRCVANIYRVALTSKHEGRRPRQSSEIVHRPCNQIVMRTDDDMTAGAKSGQIDQGIDVLRYRRATLWNAQRDRAQLMRITNV